jgi:GNAT superfamily N-acetyltransferase
MFNRFELISFGAISLSVTLVLNLSTILDILYLISIFILNIYMLVKLNWEEIHSIWRNHLWSNRSSPIEPVSAMCFLNGYDAANMVSTPTFFGYIINDNIVAVNSGHACPNQNNYRSRGLWVDPNYRRQGLAQLLLTATIEQGQQEGYTQIWSYPRQSSWPTYRAVGFKLASDWEISETSEANAYCVLNS